jgi:hypothetical protein
MTAMLSLLFGDWSCARMMYGAANVAAPAREEYLMKRRREM